MGALARVLLISRELAGRRSRRNPIYRVSGTFHGPYAGMIRAESSVKGIRFGGEPIKEKSMLYAILAYHVEAEVTSWTPQEDAAVMTGLLEVHGRLNAKKLLGPAARLGGTAEARTLRGPGDGMVIDGPFAETKEQLLGLYVVNCDNADAALDVARDLRRV